MREELEGCMDLSVPVVGELAAIESSLIPLDADKQEVLVDAEDRKELATIFLVKGGMAGMLKKGKEMEEQVKTVGAPWMLARGVKTVTVPGIGSMSLTEGNNVSISQDRLRQVLTSYVAADKIPEILSKVVKRTSYTTLMFTPEKGAVKS